MMQSYEAKDGSEIVPRGFDFGPEIANVSPAGDTIVTQTVTAFPADLIVSRVGLDPVVATKVTYEIAGGSPGSYTLTISVTLASGYVLTRQAKQTVKTGGNS